MHNKDSIEELELEDESGQSIALHNADNDTEFDSPSGGLSVPGDASQQTTTDYQPLLNAIAEQQAQQSSLQQQLSQLTDIISKQQIAAQEPGPSRVFTQLAEQQTQLLEQQRELNQALTQQLVPRETAETRDTDNDFIQHLEALSQQQREQQQQQSELLISALEKLLPEQTDSKTEDAQSQKLKQSFEQFNQLQKERYQQQQEQQEQFYALLDALCFQLHENTQAYESQSASQQKHGETEQQHAQQLLTTLEALQQQLQQQPAMAESLSPLTSLLKQSNNTLQHLLEAQQAAQQPPFAPVLQQLTEVQQNIQLQLEQMTEQLQLPNQLDITPLAASLQQFSEQLSEQLTAQRQSELKQIEQVTSQQQQILDRQQQFNHRLDAIVEQLLSSQKAEQPEKTKDIFNKAVLLARHKDYPTAARAFHKAADLGHGRAGFYLGMMYLQGNGVPKSLVHAYCWLMLADKQNVTEAAAPLKVLSRQLTAHQKQQGEFMAAEKFEKQ